MRQAHEGGARMMKMILPIWQAKACPTIAGAQVAVVGHALACRLLCFVACTPLFAAVTGTVTNQTTGKPQAGATVALYKLATATVLELIDQAKSDPRSEEHTSELQSLRHLACRLL